MGYTTRFDGILNFNRELTHREWLDLNEINKYPDECKKYTSTPDTIPNSYLQWTPTEDGTGYEWDGAEKFYDYVHWLRWVVKHYMIPHDLVLNGKLRWQGEEIDDSGYIVVVDNKVTTQKLDIKLTECPECGHRFVQDEE